jgi:hypothetical protein
VFSCFLYVAVEIPSCLTNLQSFTNHFVARRDLLWLLICKWPFQFDKLSSLEAVLLAMPPLLQFPTMISEATKRRLERKYPPTHSMNTGQPQTGHGGGESLQQIQPAILNLSPVSGTSGRRQEGRSLPSRAVTDADFDDAYVNFIMYCNPSIPLDTDTIELRKIFRAPPKSDGKTFNTFTLFELIRKLEEKEIKTWAQLAIDLGVEPPVLDKGQSAQKVQQYAVRLKVSYLHLRTRSRKSFVMAGAKSSQRWLHAMHVDAFFEFLLNKPHVYWTKVPSVSEPASEFGRDGVVAEEDLALRALLPETRPKRGRRKAEDRDDDEMGKSPSQRPRLDSPTLSEDFMIARAALVADTMTPATAHPGFHPSFDDRIVPWSATDVRPSLPNAFRWTSSDESQTPMSAYPRSAITPSSDRSQPWNDGSRSAITPNKGRSRRRHGPAVSSAWPSTGSASSGKLRGRPPSNRSVTDGPFSTFPVNPGPKDVPTISLQENDPAATPVGDSSHIPHFFPSDMRTNPPPAPELSGPNDRPSRLQLQVPQRLGGAVRLATPPPVVMLNEHDDNTIRDTALQTDPMNHAQITPHSQQFTPMMEYFQTPSTGDSDPNLQHFVSIAFRQNEDTDRTNVDALESHFISEILSADWRNASGAIIQRCSIDEASKVCKQVIKNLQAESSSTEAFLINLSALAGGPLMTRLRMTRYDHDGRTDYECHWKMRFGSIEGDFTIRATVEPGLNPMTADRPIGDSEASWKQRYLDLQQQIRERDSKVGKLKTGILDALVVSNHWTRI